MPGAACGAEQCVTHQAFRMNLSEFIEQNLDQIVDEWRAVARSLSAEAAALPRLVLDHHAPETLLAIARDMKTFQSERQHFIKAQRLTAPMPTFPRTAVLTREAARQLSGFSIGQLVAEFRALRSSVLKIWRQSGAAPVQEATLEEIARFNEGIDQALAESIERYSAEVELSRDMFLAVLGHDVRGPLNVISMATNLLESPALADSARLQVTLRIRRATNTIARLTTDLLEYARSRLGSSLPVERSNCDLREICEEAIDALKAAHPDQTVNALFSTDLQVRCDVARMQQALGNLLNNAVQHGDTSRPISVTAKREGNQVSVVVANHGRPIPEEAFTKIFEPLFHLPPERNKSFEQRSRVGLGLFIVKEIAESHGGTVSVESSPEQTAITIKMPEL